MREEKTILSMMVEDRTFPPSSDFQQRARIKDMEQYRRLYRRSMEDMEGFWAELAQQIDWFEKWDKVLEYDFTQGNVQWFKGGKLNVSYNCIDRHIKVGRGNKAALIWQGEPLEETRTLTYQQLHFEVCRFANVLKSKGIRKGDRVCLYMPMIPELPIAMLACARIGAIHSVVFGGFSAEALRDRINGCGAKLVVTSDGGYRAGRVVPLKANVDRALEDARTVESVIVCRRTGTEITMKEGRDSWWHQEMASGRIGPECKPEVMDAEDPLFILYTSGSTGKPKGVLHTTGGYLLYVCQTFLWIFDYREEELFWCTADIGWVTGHSYIVYGPLAAGATSLIFEGVPTYPKPDRFWEIVEKYRVNIFYTAPTAIRAVAREGDRWPNQRDLSSLRLLGTVGEPINPEAWLWYYNVIGKQRCPIVDTWWQTETGGILIAPLPGAMPLKPGSAGMPFPGVDAAVIREDGSQCSTDEGGYLVIRRPWPGIMRAVFGEPRRFAETYLKPFKGMYFSGDGARKDQDGYFWIMGRLDDVINVSGHRIGTAEVESALVSHPMVSEAAVVGMPHQIKGQSIYAFVVLKQGVERSEELIKGLKEHVRRQIGPIATPERIQYADALPKTRSGKIMRRILKKIAAGDLHDLGDTTTLSDPGVVERLIEERGG